jgi:hypothetical protein
MDSVTFWTAATAIFAALTALFTAIAAGASWSTVRRMREAMEASALVELAQAFGSFEMTKAHDILSPWRGKVGGGLPIDFVLTRKVGTEGTERINEARRKVAHHYQLIFNLVRIRRSKISDEFVKALVSRDQALFYREVIEPMECAVNADYDRESFEYFGRLHGIPR